MLISVFDAAGVSHTVTWQGQDQINDASAGLLATACPPTNPLAAQQVLPANPNRAGWLFQNTSLNAMLLLEVSGLNEAGGAIGVSASWVINPGQFFPPPGYPIPTGAISVVGTAQSAPGDTFAVREWINGVNE